MTWSPATGSRAAFIRAPCRGCTESSAIPCCRSSGGRLYGTPCGDIYCGLRGFDREKVAALDIRSSGMEFAIEMIVKATMQGLRVTEVPTTLSPDAEGREPHLNTWRDGWRSIRLLLLYSPKWLFLYPGLFLLVVGLVGMAWLVPGEPLDRQRWVRREHAALLRARRDRRLAVRLLLPDGALVRNHRGPAARRPADPAFGRTAADVSSGLVVGVLLVACGLGLSLYALATWNEAGFGRLDYPDTLRIVIPGATLIACGMQTVLSALFLSVLGLRRR